MKTKRKDKLFFKQAETDTEEHFIQRHHQFLNLFSGRHIAPVSYGYDGEWWVEEFVEDESVTEESTFLYGCVHLLNALKSNFVIHGDLTRHNIRVRNNLPIAIDFHESTREGEDLPVKRKEGDPYWLWHAAEELSPDTTRRIRRWRAIRPYLQDHAFGVFADYGANSGAFVSMAQAEGLSMLCIGYERDPEAVEAGRVFCQMVQKDIMDFDIHLGHASTGVLMSVYPYIAHEYGRDHARAQLRLLIDKSDQFFFETQLHGDGPGLEEHKSDDDVESFLNGLMSGTTKKVEKLVTVPVHGRSAYRSVFRIYGSDID